MKIKLSLFIVGVALAGTLVTAVTSVGCKSECMEAKEHLCSRLPEMNCFTAFMDTARERVKTSCGPDEAQRYFPWAEKACSAKTLDCTNLPDPTPGGPLPDGGARDQGVKDSKPCGTPGLFNYSGTCDPDGRSATLSLEITRTAVKGTLHGAPVCGTSIRLQRTDITFTGTLSGTWESGSATIQASWTGGDYDCDGKLMSGWPTSGSLTITIVGNQVQLQRAISNAGKYIFSTSGKTYQAPDC